MPASSEMSSSRDYRSSSRGWISPGSLSQRYFGTTYIWVFLQYFKNLHFLCCTSGSALPITIDHSSRETAVGAQCKKWKHWCGRGASTLSEACCEVDSPFTDDAGRMETIRSWWPCSLRCVIGPQCRLSWPPTFCVWAKLLVIFTSPPTAHTSLKGFNLRPVWVSVGNCWQGCRKYNSSVCSYPKLPSITAKSQRGGRSMNCLFFRLCRNRRFWITTVG